MNHKYWVLILIFLPCLSIAEINIAPLSNLYSDLTDGQLFTIPYNFYCGGYQCIHPISNTMTIQAVFTSNYIINHMKLYFGCNDLETVNGTLYYKSGSSYVTIVAFTNAGCGTDIYFPSVVTDEINIKINNINEYDGDNIISVQEIEIYCPYIPTITPTSTVTLTFTTTPTFTFTPVNTATPYQSDEIIIFPNPFNISKAREQKLKILNMPYMSIMVIYSISGEFVYSLEGQNQMEYWNGSNIYGKRVAPGIYFYTIRKNGIMIKNGKLLVINN